jgi:hypothetical protein
VCTENLIHVDEMRESPKLTRWLRFYAFAILASPLKSRSRLEAENAALRHQLIIMCRQRPVRVRLTNNDRLFFIQLYRWFPSILKVLTVVRGRSTAVSPMARGRGRGLMSIGRATRPRRPSSCSSMAAAGNAVRAISTVLSALRWRRKVEIRHGLLAFRVWRVANREILATQSYS